MNKSESGGKQVWINDTNNKKYAQIKASFVSILQEHTKDSRIGYYDFLLVAKKLSFRFQESAHLMALKNFFSRNKNSVMCKKLSDCLCISEQSLYTSEQKVIVKFNVPEIQFAPIKEQTLQDEQFDERNENDDQQNDNFHKLGSQVDEQHERELMEKMAIILSIKVEQMQKKLISLTTCSNSLLNYFDDSESNDISYDTFKNAIIDIVSSQNNIKEKIKISEDDVKTIFHILDEDKKSFLTLRDIDSLRDFDQMLQKMKQFYKSRINRDMVKNTLFKLGKVKNNSIQIYQLKNASLMEFKQIQDSIINDKSSRQMNIKPKYQMKEKSRIPHFGPLKGAAKWQKQKNTRSQPHYTNNFAASTHPNTGPNIFSINKERQKIQKILKQSKDLKVGKGERNSQTVASKLRSLFIHKVILPRQKMLQEQKQKFIKSKLPDHQLSIRPYK